MTRLIGWLRIALLDLRGDLGRFGVLLACLALGVGTITAVGTVGAALQSAIARDARLVLGGDLEAQLSYRAATAQERAMFDELGTVTEVIEAAGRARSETGGAFVTLRAVDQAYPLIGAVTVADSETQDLATLLAPRDGVYGMVANSLVLDRMAIGLNVPFELGTARFAVTGVLEALPDQATQGIQLGIPGLISLEALGAAKVLEPGVLARYRYKVALEGVDYPTAKARILAAFPDAGWQVRDPAEAAETLARFADLFGRFLIVVGLSSLLVGGVGVSNAVSAYISERERSIATMRSLGATSARIMVHFLAQILVLTVLGIILGVVLGSLLAIVALPIIGDLLSVRLDPQVHLPSVIIASAFGLLIGFAFAFVPLSRARFLRPAMLFRSAGGGSVEGKLGWRQIVRPEIAGPLLLAGAGIGLLALAITGRPLLVFWYTVGVIAGFVLLRLAGWGLQALLRLLPPPANSALRNALKSIYRPGALAPAVIVSLGMGLALLLLIALIDNNIRNQISGAIAEEAPDFVLMDLFDDEVAELEALAGADPRIASFEATPMLRAAITKVNGTPVSELSGLPEDVAFVFQGEAPITWLRELPEGSEVIEGEWWPPDYDGPPLLSLSDDFKEPLGLEVGDSFEFNLVGEMVTATIANFRHFEWQEGGVNFALALSPGYVEEIPGSYLGLMKAAPGEERAVQTMLVEDYPEMVFLPVGDALEAIARILGSLSDAIAVVGGLAVVSGLFVLAGAMAAGRRQREADAVVMKVLGATRGDVIRAYLIEYGLLGALAAIVAAILGVAGAWALVTEVMELDFSIDYGLIVMVVLGAVVATVTIGTITTWSALSVRPASFLRGE